MSERTITEDRLLALIETYGADTNNFPETERAAAERLMLKAPHLFSDALEGARHVDTLLEAIPDMQTPERLRSALIASAPGPARNSAKAFGWKFPLWVPAGAVASLAIGLLAGSSVAQIATYQEDPAETLVYAALGFDDYSLDLDSEISQ